MKIIHSLNSIVPLKIFKGPQLLKKFLACQDSGLVSTGPTPSIFYGLLLAHLELWEYFGDHSIFSQQKYYIFHLLKTILQYSINIFQYFLYSPCSYVSDQQIKISSYQFEHSNQGFGYVLFKGNVIVRLSYYLSRHVQNWVNR